MGLKRKLSIDFADDVACNSKQPRLFAFPSSAELESDVAMSDGSVSELTPLSIPAQSFHSRLVSTASSTSSSAFGDSPDPSPYYPSFELYPGDAQDQMTVDSANYFNRPAQSSPRQVGLMQPKGTSFTHHGQNCSQIPKLRMACSSGLNGQRTMWAHCEECGAIEMVDTD
ncbi:hypothetical protein K474DRAFT_573571 [Panus rudis PR-1116 ss-1]|nr:hypothetical protein K474DRAFT_573571 [Panus rudis PR-1116 ss-1]